MELYKERNKIKKNKVNNDNIDERIDSLYLHNRKLDHLPILQQKFYYITKLFIQNNFLKNLKGLNGLRFLKMLNISYNNLSIISDLNHCHSLEYLDVQKQIIDGNEIVRFEPRTSESLKKCLIVLNCSGNNLEEIANIKLMTNIQTLNLSDNRIDNLNKLINDLLNFPKLKILNLKNNKICRQKNYISNILRMEAISGAEIEQLDNYKILPEIRKHYISVYKTDSRDRRKNDFFLEYIGERCETLSTAVREGVQENVMRNNKLIQLINNDLVT